VPPLVSPALGAIGFSPNVLLNTLAVTAVVVYLMVYVVMPRYTRLLQRWLSHKTPRPCGSGSSGLARTNHRLQAHPSENPEGRTQRLHASVNVRNHAE
jgi:hypothetical protein